MVIVDPRNLLDLYLRCSSSRLSPIAYSPKGVLSPLTLNLNSLIRKLPTAHRQSSSAAYNELKSIGSTLYTSSKTLHIGIFSMHGSQRGVV